MNKDSLLQTALKRKEKERPALSPSASPRQRSTTTNENHSSLHSSSLLVNAKVACIRNANKKHECNSMREHDHDKPGDVPNSDVLDHVDVSHLTENVTQKILQNGNSGFTTTGAKENFKTESIADVDNAVVKGKKTCKLLDETQTQKIKKILVDCLQNIDRMGENSKENHEVGHFCNKPYGILDKYSENENVPINNNIVDSADPLMSTTDTLAQASLLRSYLSGSNPAREEYISKSRNVSNSLISSDSVHHSIFLESGRERRQCLLQYLTKVVSDGQVVIYVNSIPGAEALKNFLKKHGFPVDAVHPKLLLAESNWILSEFSLKKFSVLLCAEDHYHSCPAHFRWVKTIINYELPICNPTENWSARNGIVEFSDNLPVHIYTFIKKSCPLDHELVKLLRLDSQEDLELIPVP